MCKLVILETKLANMFYQCAALMKNCGSNDKTLLESVVCDCLYNLFAINTCSVLLHYHTILQDRKLVRAAHLFCHCFCAILLTNLCLTGGELLKEFSKCDV